MHPHDYLLSAILLTLILQNYTRIHGVVRRFLRRFK